jgi:hypothetical protein
MYKPLRKDTQNKECAREIERESQLTFQYQGLNDVMFLSQVVINKKSTNEEKGG